MFKIVDTLPVKMRLPLVAWVLAGLVTIFSLVTSLIQVSGPTVEAAKPGTAHYASMTDLLNLFGALYSKMSVRSRPSALRSDFCLWKSVAAGTKCQCTRCLIGHCQGR